MCVVKNIYTTIRCKSCGKPRSVFLLGGTKVREEDKARVNAFLEDQAQTYTCGTDFSELASAIQVSKTCLRPYCQTQSGNLTVSCLHPVDEKVYKLDQHKRTCSQCGDESNNPIVSNQFPLCVTCHEKGWPFKAFTVIAKRVYAKRAKAGNDVVVVGEEVIEVEGNHDDNNNDENFNDNNDNFNYNNHDEINEHNNNTEENEDYIDDPDDADSTTEVVEIDLVSGSKKRNSRSKKTTDNNLVCNSDTDFLQMHGSGEFSSLPCNDFSNKELLKRLDNKAHNNKLK